MTNQLRYEPYFFERNLCKCFYPNWFKLGFPTERDSATFRDKGTEVPSLSRDILKQKPIFYNSKGCFKTGK